MSGEPILRPEFDLYVKMSAEANEKTAKAIESIAESHKESIKESRETNQILKEYIIHNNHKHDETNKRITSLAKKLNKVEEVVKANAKVTSWANTMKKGVIILVAGALTAVGGYYGLQIVDEPKQIEKSNDPHSKP